MSHFSPKTLPRTKTAKSASPRKGVEDYTAHTSLRIVQGELKYRLAHQHQLLRAITAVRDLGLESARFSFQHQSFARLSKNIRTMTPGQPARRPVRDDLSSMVQPTNAILSQSERVIRATKVQAASVRETWIKSRGLVSQCDTRSHMAAAKSLFAALSDSDELINCGALIGHLLSTGLATSASEATLAFAEIFCTKEVCALQLNEQRFLSIFRTKRVVDHIIEILKDTVEDQQSREVPIMRQSTLEAQTHIDWMYPTFSRLLSVLRDWWQEVNKQRTENIHVRKVAQLFVEKGVVGNRFEGKKLVSAHGSLFEGAYVKEAHFLRIFYPAVVKATLLNLAVGMSAELAGNAPSPLRVRMADYERKRILTGLKSRKANCVERATYHEFSQFVKSTSRLMQRAQQKTPMGQRDAAPIPSVTKDLTLDFIAPVSPLTAPRTADSEVPMLRSVSVRNDEHKDFLELNRWNTQNEWMKKSEDGESVVETRPRLNQKYFKSAAGTPLPRDVRLFRENRLHEHFTNMVQYASELDHALACFSPLL